METLLSLVILGLILWGLVKLLSHVFPPKTGAPGGDDRPDWMKK